MVRAYLLCFVRSAPPYLQNQISTVRTSSFIEGENLKSDSIMEIYTGQFIQGILNEIPKQNNHEKYITIYPFTKYHNILLNFEIIQFDESCCCCCVTPLEKIFGATVIDDVLYILFKNYTLHILYMNGEHDILMLESRPSKIEKAKMKLNHLLDINLN